MNPSPVIDYVFKRDRFWFLEPTAPVAERPDNKSLLVSLTEAFSAGPHYFASYSDAEIQSGLMFLASDEGVAGVVLGEELDLEIKVRFVRSHLPMFQDVVVSRARNPASPVNEVCLFYFDSFFEYSGLAMAEVERGKVFYSLHDTLCLLFGLYPALDEGIHRALSRWFPHLLAPE
ncbi:MAG: hypothetical protein V4710_03005 [Verrucomicrobiota bacterium]